MTITAVHRFGTPCGRVAFFYDEDGAPPNSIQAERVSLPDGTKPTAGDTMICGSCGAPISLDAIDLLPGEWDVKVIR